MCIRDSSCTTPQPPCGPNLPAGHGPIGTPWRSGPAGAAARPSGLRGQHALDRGGGLLDVAVVHIEMRHEAHGPRAFVEAEHARLAEPGYEVGEAGVLCLD